MEREGVMPDRDARTEAPGQKILDRARLRPLLERAWSKETSVDPAGWSVANPAWGQCAVTALVVQDLYGGDLLRCKVRGISHYLNRLVSGDEVDLTRDQFGTEQSPATLPELRTREFVLSFPDTAQRYSLLKARVEELLTHRERPENARDTP